MRWKIRSEHYWNKTQIKRKDPQLLPLVLKIFERKYATHLFPRKIRWLDRLVDLVFEIMTIKGKTITVADGFSRHGQGVHSSEHYSNAMLQKSRQNSASKYQCNISKRNDPRDSGHIFQGLPKDPEFKNMYENLKYSFNKYSKLLYCKGFWLQKMSKCKCTESKSFKPPSAAGHSTEKMDIYHNGLCTSTLSELLAVMLESLESFIKFQNDPYNFSTTECNFTVCTENIRNHVYSNHGILQVLVSNRNNIFMSRFWSSLFKKLGTKKKQSSAYHAYIDGSSKIFNRKVKEMVQVFSNFDQSNQDEDVIDLEGACNFPCTAQQFLPTSFSTMEFIIRSLLFRPYIQKIARNFMSLLAFKIQLDFPKKE